MRLYSPPIKTGISGTYDRGRDVKQIMKTVRLDKRGLADLGHRKVREMTCYHPEHAGEALGKPRGFGRRDVGARTPYIEPLRFSCFLIVLSRESSCIAINVTSFVCCFVARRYSLLKADQCFTEFTVWWSIVRRHNRNLQNHSGISESDNLGANIVVLRTGYEPLRFSCFVIVLSHKSGCIAINVTSFVCCFVTRRYSLLKAD